MSDLELPRYVVIWKVRRNYIVSIGIFILKAF